MDRRPVPGHVTDPQQDPAARVPDTPYQPGACNIGPAEIARRRRAGRVGLVSAVGLGIGLQAVHAPPLARLLVALPAAVSASGFLQARLRFCAAFGARGVYNFEAVGPTVEVADETARAADRALATRIGLASALIGVATGIGAVLTAR